MRKGQPGMALAVVDEGRLQFNRFFLTETELIVPDDVTVGEWAELGRFLLGITVPIEWWLLDWLSCGENRGWGETYREIADEYGVRVDTPSTYVSAVRNLDSSIRNRGLSLAHHRLVVSKPQEEQRHWLEAAAASGWTVSQMRDAIRGKPPTRSKGFTNRVINFFGEKWQKYQYYESRLDKIGQGDLSQMEQLVEKDLEQGRKLLAEIRKHKK